MLENEEHSGVQLESYVAKGLERPFLVRVSEGGRIQALGTTSDVSGVAYNILRNVVGALQFVEPAGTNPSFDNWETEESDQTGICKARYRKKGGGGYEKTKLGYSYAASAGLAGRDSKKLPTVQSVTDLIWKGGRVERAALVESISQPFGEQATFKSKTHVTLELTSSGKGLASKVETEGFEFLRLFQLKAAKTDPNEARKQKEALVNGASFHDLNALFSKFPDRLENRDARWRAAQRLSALFELDPSTLAAALQTLRSSPDSADRDMLLNALSDADSPEARAALAGLARDRGADAGLRGDAVRHLGLNEQGSEEAVQALVELAADRSDRNIHGAATLALGSAANAAANTDGLEHATERAVKTLSEGYQRASTPEEQRLNLEALGNAGSAGALDLIRSALTSPDPTVRAAAAESLRRVVNEQADALLASTLRGDPDPRVRAAAVNALTERELGPALTNALAEALRSETEVSVRQQIITVLTSMAPRSEGARALLAWAAKNDPSEGLREAATRALKIEQAGAPQ